MTGSAVTPSAGRTADQDEERLKGMINDERIVARVGDSSSKTAADWLDDHRTELLA
ncbi:hypothetical protein OHA72_39385 [Dactylosporangium sp. NBC_01737]|uniref:hypothetical protein n=1 Tax=Dactylosporangium sp. NBC_01737 TaxID=2975959 RepID=UPI002E0F8A33|nr:hypothetical protein OHA72_39385 [Dactylosporangium sp. NBC_01737]